MALETIRNGYRGEQITEEIATPRYRSWEFELRRKATMWINTDNLPQRDQLPSLSALPILARRCPLLDPRNPKDCRTDYDFTPTSPLAWDE